MHTNEQRTAPGYGKEVIIASQGEGLLLLDATQLEFVAGDLASAQDSDVTLVYEAGDISGFTAMDNLFWSPNGRVYVNEDDGEGDIWQVDVNSLRASQAAGDTTPSPGQVTDVLDADGVRLGESAGIIDISEMIGEAPGTFFLTTGYASAVTDNQLAMLVAPKATNSPHGTLQVTQVNANNDSGAVDGELLDFTSLNVSYDDSGSSRGDFDLEFAPEFDNSSGVLFTAIAENGRDNSAFGDPAGTFYGTCAIDRDGDDYFIAASSSTGELNIDVAFAYLRKSDWLVGHAYNSSGTNGGANDVLNASPGINLGTQFIDNGGGISTLDLTGLGASSADGILLVNGGKNEDNFALSRANGDGSFTIYSLDNGQATAGTYEQDPVAFAYLPYEEVGTKGLLAMGRLANSLASCTLKNGINKALALSAPSDGVWELSLDGYSPENATLIVSAEGGGNFNVDNAVSYEWNAGDEEWVIHCRDLPGYNLQGGATSDEIMVNFAIFRSVQQGGELFVDGSASGSDTGEDWTNAYEDLQDALAFAQPGERIHVAEGTCFPDEGKNQVANSVLSTFAPPSGVSIFGGFPSGGSILDDRDPAANPSILDGDIDGSFDPSGNAYHVVTVTDPSAPVVLDGFTIRNGNAVGSNADQKRGGGVYATNAHLLMTDCLVRDNIAEGDGGGIYASGGSLTLTDSTVRSNTTTGDGGDGGGIHASDVAAVVSGCLITDNELAGDSAYGGGIECNGASGNLTLSDSTISNNRVLGNGGTGGIDIVGSSVKVRHCRIENNVADAATGGGIYVFGGSVEVTGTSITGNSAGTTGGLWIGGGAVSLANSTLADNQSGTGFVNGGATILEGSLTLDHVTMTGNNGGSGGGGLYLQSPAVVTVKDSIIAANTAVGTSNADIYRSSGALNTQGTNLIGNNSSVTGQFPTGPLVGTAADPVDPLLLPLTEYGGGSLSAPPRLGSPAIDVLGAPTLLEDQRGVARSDGAGDLGAVEYLPPVVVTNADDTGEGSLREVLARPTTTAITFDPTVFNGESSDEIRLASTLVIPRPVEIDGRGIPEGVIISGDFDTRVFDVNGVELILRSLTVSDGDAGNSPGGAMWLRGGGRANLHDCLFERNRTNGFPGGAIYCSESELEAINTTFTRNTGGNGSAILSEGFSTMLLRHCTIAGNTSEASGGAVANFANATLENTVIADNNHAQYADSGTTLFLGNNFTSGDPQLQSLADFGGPTRMMLPRITSPLVDAAALLPTNPQTDSRGLARSSDGDFDGISLPDIGAGEINIRYVTTATDETLDPGTGVSLREAVADPQPTDLIGFVPALHGSTLTLSQGAIPVSGQAEIIGPDDGITLDANQTGRHFSVEPGGFLAIAYLTLTGGNGTGLNGGEDNRGGSIFNLGRLVLIGCTLHGNSAAADGGAIFNKDSDGMLLYACTLDGNSCVGEGGAIYTLRADSQLYSCTLTRNQSGPTRRGGGILVRGGSQTRLANCLIEGNLAGTGGGPNILVENPSDLTVAGALLMDDYAGSTVSPGGDLLLGDGRLSPLGDFGGPTPVRLPLPESDALDAGAGNNLPEDQRGVVRSAVYDIGAVEFQGGSEFTALWETDDDGDGVPFGVELALGFDPFSSSPSAGQAIGFSRNVFGQSNFSFPLDPAVAPYTIWVVERSSPGLDNFQEIYRLAGPTDVETSTSDVSSNYSGAGDTDITITDENPPGGSAFYRFRALQAP